MRFYLDLETRSEVDLTKVGAWHYALHPSTQVMCLTYGPSRERLQTFAALDFGWDWGKLRVSGIETDYIVAHNVGFEYAVYNLILHRRHGWPARWDPRLWGCTMARAAMVGLPPSLDELGRALMFKTPKDLEGRRIMHQLCKPSGIDALGDPIFDNSPAKFKRLLEYNRTDVLAEIEADEQLPELPANERPIFELDLVMNRRGIQVDTAMAAKAAALSSAVMGPLNDRLRELTGGQLDRATQTAALKRYLAINGVTIPTRYKDGEEKDVMDRVAIIEMLARPDMPAKMREVLELRQQASKSTSVAKYVKALEMACPDGRVRGNLQYHGAHTGRWSGRLLQAHNFPKGFSEIDEQAKAVQMILDGTPRDFVAGYGIRAMGALSDALRGMIIAAPGKELVSADFNAIEARVVFWLAGDEGALATYRRGESPYVEMANYIYNRTDITKKGNPKEYDIGKRSILGCGFGMGWSKFKVSVYEETAKSTGIPVLLEDELAERAVRAYRELHAPVVRLWREIETAVVTAVKSPGTVYQSCGGRVLWSMSRDRRFLVAKLPSGRYLWYYKPSVRVGKTPWGEEKGEMVYWGRHPKTGEWCQLKTYGGLLIENVVQAVARDVMAYGMLAAEAAGFTMVLTVHDELLAEIAAAREGDLNSTGYGAFQQRQDTLDKFIKIICRLPDWAGNLPVLAEGWIGQRYRK